MSATTVDTEVSEELAPATRVAPMAHPVSAPLRTASAAIAPVAGGGRSSAVARLSELGFLALAQTTYQLRRLGSATLAGIVALVAAVTIFISYNMPEGTAVSALQAEMVHAPVVGTTATPNGASLASLPPRSQAPDVVAKIYEEAKAAGVELPRGQYEYVPPRDGMAARYRLTFPVHASYPQIRGFLDRTLIALPAVAVEGLRIERKTVGDGSVDAEVKFAAYVRGEP